MSRIDPLVQALAMAGSRPIEWDEGAWLLKCGPYVLFETQRLEAVRLAQRLETAWRRGWLYARWVIAGLPVLKPGLQTGLVFRLYAPALEEAGWRQRRKVRRDLGTLARCLLDESVSRGSPRGDASRERERREGCERERLDLAARGWGHLAGGPLDGLMGRGRIARRIDPETRPVVAALAEHGLTAVYAVARQEPSCKPVFVFMAPSELGEMLSGRLRAAQQDEITLNACWHMHGYADDVLETPLLMPFVLSTRTDDLSDEELRQDLAVLAGFIRTALDDLYGCHWWLEGLDGRRGCATTDASQP